MKYNKEWMLECILLRMRSPKLYDYIRRQNILVLPGNTTIRKYISSYMANFGFNENMLQTLKKKTATMDRFKCQGDIVIDEMKLSEHLSVNTAGKVNGFVDLGTYTPEEQKQLPCDHGLVVMFVPLIGSWSQILGTFATRTDIKGELLAKIVLEATILAEKAGLFVNYDTCDAATWNRKMWRMMGVKANSKEVIAKRVHPSDDKRSLYFLSDFPHLVKNIRNRLLQTSFHTPDGKVSMAPLREALKLDENNLTLKAMPRLTKTHLEPNDFEKMRVSLAFQTFGSDSLRGLQLYKPQLEKSCGNIEPTQKFFRRMKSLITTMTTRYPAEALRPNSPAIRDLEEFLEFLTRWEQTADKKNFLSESTTEGLRVTIRSTLGLLSYIHEELGYAYLMTSRLSQDKIENLFGIVRLSSGCNAHPTLQQFLTTINCLSYYNLAKSVPGSNVPEGVVSSLLTVADKTVNTYKQQQLIDLLLDEGDLEGAEGSLHGSSLTAQCRSPIRQPA
ncbi:transposable element P transposase isoform X1 [Rhipicephalus microplus]|uniref:transposable element P transposase isoform X1 n=1 Tax=Rhipicephalus microplus TaxID=6941 RepID=UPI003F6C959D